MFVLLLPLINKLIKNRLNNIYITSPQNEEKKTFKHYMTKVFNIYICIYVCNNNNNNRNN